MESEKCMMGEVCRGGESETHDSLCSAHITVDSFLRVKEREMCFNILCVVCLLGIRNWDWPSWQEGALGRK